MCAEQQTFTPDVQYDLSPTACCRLPAAALHQQQQQQEQLLPSGMFSGCV
jgi:hypothetical protein